MAYKARPAIDRFWEKVNKTETCWLWVASCFKNGYGQFHPTGETTVYAHRWLYEYECGKIPDGLQIDHVKNKGCYNRACVKLEHLEVVTSKENILRGNSPSALNSRKKVCPKCFGEYTIIVKTGKRRCYSCNRIWQQERRKNVSSKA